MTQRMPSVQSHSTLMRGLELRHLEADWKGDFQVCDLKRRFQSLQATRADFLLTMRTGKAPRTSLPMPLCGNASRPREEYAAMRGARNEGISPMTIINVQSIKDAVSKGTSSTWQVTTERPASRRHPCRRTRLRHVHGRLSPTRTTGSTSDRRSRWRRFARSWAKLSDWE